jgi:hypothetical protein
VVVDDDEDEVDAEVELDDVLVSSLVEVVVPARTVGGASLMLTSEASGRSIKVVEGRTVVCWAIVDDGNTSVGTSADCGRRRAAANRAKTRSTPIGTNLFTTCSLHDQPTSRLSAASGFLDPGLCIGGLTDPTMGRSEDQNQTEPSGHDAPRHCA